MVITRRPADAEASAGQLQGRPRGTLRITSSYSLMLSLVGPLLAEFRILYPEVQIDLILSHRTLDLVEDQIYFALRMGPLVDSAMVARRLAVLPNRIYASPAYPAEHGEPQHPFELQRHFALVTRVARRGSGYAWPMHKDGVTESYEITPVIESDDPEVLRAPLFAGAGLMMATDMIMARHAAEGWCNLYCRAGWAAAPSCTPCSRAAMSSRRNSGRLSISWCIG